MGIDPWYHPSNPAQDRPRTDGGKWAASPEHLQPLAVSGDTPEYRAYCADLERLYHGAIKPAPFLEWRRTSNSINAFAAIGYW